jgi:polar amino acid transport system substrate-binding protein
MKLKISLAGCFAVIALSTIITFLDKIHFPKDAEDSLEKIMNHTIRVGFTNASPWVYPADGKPEGIEADIVANFAKTLNAKVDWVEGTEEQLYKALRRDEIDILIAGITDETLWHKEVGLTKPYIETEIVIGQPASPVLSNQKAPVEGQWVAVKKGTDQGYHVRKMNAKPFYTTQLPATRMFSAAYEWQLQKWQLQNTGIVLEKESHVIGVPPGENALLLALDKYLFCNKASIRKQLTD